MKRSTIAVVLTLLCYLIFAGIIISAVAKSYGSHSIAMYITIIAVGPIGLGLIITHKGLNSWIKGLDKKDN